MSTATSAGPTTTLVTHLWLTDDEAACKLLAADSAAFIIGWILDQQITVQKAFRGPFDLLERVGTLDPNSLASMPLAQIEEAFGRKPALHRFPTAMARRVHEAMRIIVDQWEGDPSRMWRDVTELDVLEQRLEQLPGFGAGKITSAVALLARQCGVSVTGWEERIPEWGTLGDVGSPEDLRAYQARKRVVKQAARAAAKARSST